MWSLRLSVISALACVVSLQASSSNNGNNNPSPFLYSEMSMNMDSDNFSETDDLSDASASVVGSSLLYEGGCQVSSQAMMLSGGDDSLNCLGLDYTATLDLNSDYQDQDQESDDEEDDDEDDGHSSMLSNASVRSKAVAVGSEDHYTPQSSYSNNESSDQTVSFEAEISLKKNTLALTALGVRGGAVAVAPSVGNELAKKLIVAAIVTLIFEGCIGHVLELFKIVMQTSPPGTTYTSVYKDITGKKGVAGIWDGFAPWGIVQAVLKGGVFGLAHSIASKALIPLAEDGKLPMQLALTLAGGIGGGFQGYVLSPTLLLKTRVMTNPVFREKMSALKTTWLSLCIGGEVIKTEGLITLMKGANVFATKRVFDWASRYFFADMFEALFVTIKSSSLTPLEKSISSLLGGVASTVVTLPLDVLVAKTQDAKKAGVKVSAVTLFMEELNEKGVKGLKESYMQGFEARLIHVCLTTVVIKTLAPIVYAAMYGTKA
jgi:hypothetical protein